MDKPSCQYSGSQSGSPSSACKYLSPPSQVLKDLDGEKSLERFRNLYETVLQAVRRSHGNVSISLELGQIKF